MLGSVQTPSLCANYLEAIITKGVGAAAIYHTELAHIYLRLALNEGGHTGANQSGHGRIRQVLWYGGD